MGDLRKNFSAYEFRCGDGCGLTNPTPELLDALQRLRDAVGKPLTIVSGSRCVRHNRAVGGATNSQHPRGRAADIPGGYATPVQVRDAGFHGCGMRGGRVIHVDVTPGRSFWMFQDG